jgi:hypothetical protein
MPPREPVRPMILETFPYLTGWSIAAGTAGSGGEHLGTLASLACIGYGGHTKNIRETHGDGFNVIKVTLNRDKKSTEQV